VGISEGQQIQSICCIGAGYVGGPTMAVIGDRCTDVQVTVVDLNAERIAAWNDLDLGQLPVYEPGLDAVMARSRGRNLHFSTAVEHVIAAADLVFISVNTPTKPKGLGADQASDLKWVNATALTWQMLTEAGLVSANGVHGQQTSSSVTAASRSQPSPLSRAWRADFWPRAC